MINHNYSHWSSDFAEVTQLLNPYHYSYISGNEKYQELKQWIQASTDDIHFFNNKVYAQQSNPGQRLLIADLIQNLSNVSIVYNTEIHKLIFSSNNNSVIDGVQDQNGTIHYCSICILCAGAIQTPIILQRSGIDSGSSLYDHAGFTLVYNKVEAITTTTTTTQPYSGSLDFILNLSTIEKINDYSGRYVFKVEGINVNSDDLNKVYDFTNWSTSHPGGTYNITKWRSSNYTLNYPHDSGRWNSNKSNFIEIGTLNSSINYNNLPSNLKSSQLYNYLFPEVEQTETNTEYQIQDLGFSPNTILSHVQTRDSALKWQSYYSTIPDQPTLLIVTHALSTDLNSAGSVKVITNDTNDTIEINLNHFDSSDKIQYLMQAFTSNHNILTSNGFSLLGSPIVDTDFIENNSNSIYHYHGSCPFGTVVDENFKVIGYNNLFIGDISVLNQPWGGSTSVPALVTGFRCAKSIISYQHTYGLNLNITSSDTDFISHVNQAKDIIDSFVTIIDSEAITISLVEISEAHTLGYAVWATREIGINQALSSSADMLKSDGTQITVHNSVPVIIHEILHILGIGGSAIWYSHLIENNSFYAGPNGVREYRRIFARLVISRCRNI